MPFPASSLLLQGIKEQATGGRKQREMGISKWPWYMSDCALQEEHLYFAVAIAHLAFPPRSVLFPGSAWAPGWLWPPAPQM